MQHELRGNRAFTDMATNAVGTKIFTLRHQTASLTAATTFTASTESLTSCTRRMLAPFIADIVAAERIAGNQPFTSRPVIALSIHSRDTAHNSTSPNMCKWSSEA